MKIGNQNANQINNNGKKISIGRYFEKKQLKFKILNQNGFYISQGEWFTEENSKGYENNNTKRHYFVIKDEKAESFVAGYSFNDYDKAKKKNDSKDTYTMLIGIK